MGGSATYGTVFKMTPTGSVAILHSFGDGSVANDGHVPLTSIIEAEDGNFYGTTTFGGAGMQRTVFKMTPSGMVTILHSFSDGSVMNDGAEPQAALIQASDGDFYGTTQLGGASPNNGTVFKVTPSGVLTVLHSFGDGTVANDGSQPLSSLLQAADGSFYGTTFFGGFRLGGTVYKITPEGHVTILHSFPDSGVTADGEAPYGSLVRYTDGSYYGTTAGGVAENSRGTVFRMAVRPNRFDFNDDGYDDLLFQNSIGQTLVWDMVGQAPTYGHTFATLAPPWHTAAVADINADSQPDLLWWNSSTGQCLFWEMGGQLGTDLLLALPTFATVADTDWHPVSMADFDNDGSPDILWENFSTGQLLVWYMNGGEVKKYGSPFITLPAHWIVAGTADFNQDGHPDILLENNKTGQLLVWYFTGASGTTLLSYGATFKTIADTTWKVVSTGDLNADGHPDITWYNDRSGQVLIWLMGGPTGTEVNYYGTSFATVPTSWNIVGVH